MRLRELFQDESGKLSQTKAMGWLAFIVVSAILVNESTGRGASPEFALGYLGFCIAGRAFSAFNHRRNRAGEGETS